MANRPLIKTWRSQLRQALMNYFDESGLRTLCFDLGFDYDELAGANKVERVIDLIEHVCRIDAVADLTDLCGQQRPNVPWNRIAAAAAREKAEQGHLAPSPRPVAPDPRPPVASAREALPLTAVLPWAVAGVLFVVIGALLLFSLGSRRIALANNPPPMMTDSPATATPSPPSVTPTRPPTAQPPTRTPRPTNPGLANPGLTNPGLTITLPPAQVFESPVLQAVEVAPGAPEPIYAIQTSYNGDCLFRPEGVVCLTFDDGFRWLVSDAIQGWTSASPVRGQPVQVALGFKADYYHVLGTNLVKTAPK